MRATKGKATAANLSIWLLCDCSVLCKKRKKRMKCGNILISNG